jgi:hypothetical protein
MAVQRDGDLNSINTRVYLVNPDLQADDFRKINIVFMHKKR